MGNSLSKIYDDYERYELLCEKVGVVPRPLDSSFYEHEKELMEKNGWERTYFGYQKKEQE